LFADPTKQTPVMDLNEAYYTVGQIPDVRKKPLGLVLDSLEEVSRKPYFQKLANNQLNTLSINDGAVKTLISLLYNLENYLNSFNSRKSYTNNLTSIYIKAAKELSAQYIVDASTGKRQLSYGEYLKAFSTINVLYTALSDVKSPLKAAKFLNTKRSLLNFGTIVSAIIILAAVGLAGYDAFTTGTAFLERAHQSIIIQPAFLSMLILKWSELQTSFKQGRVDLLRTYAVATRSNLAVTRYLPIAASPKSCASALGL